MSDGRPRIDAPKRSGGDGVPEVFCINEQNDVDVDLQKWRGLALAALQEENVRGAAEISIFFVDSDTIAELNSEHMGKTGPTDVLAFPLDGVEVLESQGPGAISKGPARPHFDPDDIPTMLGDVLLCPSVAAQQAPSHAGTLDDEIALLLVHGILHVLGYDHDADDTTARMRQREKDILERHHWCGLAPVAFRQEHSE